MAFIPAKCTQCGAHIEIDNTKEAGICNYCGTAFITEKAINYYNTTVTNNNVFYGATINVASHDLEKLYEVARRFKEASNYSEALKYYEMILPEDPESWEAYFYCTFCKVVEVRRDEVEAAAQSIVLCLDTVFDMVDNREKTEQDKKLALEEITDSCLKLANSYHTFILTPDRTDIPLLELSAHFKEVAYICLIIASIGYMIGDKIEQKYASSFDQLAELAVKAWKQGVEIHADCNKFLPNKEQGYVVIDEYAQKISEYDPTYAAPIQTKSPGGCYVATAVYGSYDCPEVWTLRRFRDYTLAETWYGRLFIRAYYAISPTLVYWFGRTTWFKNLWKPTLDRMVKRLNKSGVTNSPYEDRIW